MKTKMRKLNGLLSIFSFIKLINIIYRVIISLIMITKAFILIFLDAKY